MPDLRVLIVADDPLARAGLATLLTQNAGWSVVGHSAWPCRCPGRAASLPAYREERTSWQQYYSNFPMPWRPPSLA